jgi:hypothetical protein
VTSHHEIRSIRNGLRSPGLFNSGLEVWLYDQASTEAIRDSSAFEALYQGDTEQFEARMQPLIEAGRIVAYGMEGDGPIDIEVIVGDPLTAAELALARWMEPQEALLCLPTGKLCVDSNDTLRFNADATDPGAVLEVPPGSYRLTLYRLDWDDMQREGLFQTYGGAREVVTLTPDPQARPVPGQPAILPYRPTVRKPAPYTIAQGACSTRIYFDDYWDTLQLGIDRVGLERLGVAEGSLLQVEAPVPGFATTLVYVENDGSAQAMKRMNRILAPAGRPQKEWGHAYLMQTATTGGQEVLFCFRRNAQLCIPEAHKKVWLPATARVVQPGRSRGRRLSQA